VRALRILAVVALLAGLAGCADEPGEEVTAPPVTVSGAFGRAPVVTFETPLPLAEAEVETVITGDGRELVADGPALLALTAFDGADGEILAERGAGEARTLLLTEDDVGADLHKVLVGTREGSRLLVTQPVTAEGADRMLVLVIDALHTMARGEPVEPQEGMPAVEVDAAGVPSIVVPDAEPPAALQVAQLLRGEGAQVRPGQDVTLQYTAVTWGGGEVYDSTWAAGAVPRTVAIDDTFPGLRDALVDQRVGSRVLVVVPPELGAGTDTLVLVVDILTAAGSGDDDVVVPSPAPSE
jgi:peptidylprolyl isomerase